MIARPHTTGSLDGLGGALFAVGVSRSSAVDNCIASSVPRRIERPTMPLGDRA
jgi:hypothetical protein